MNLVINCKNQNCIYNTKPIDPDETGVIEECPLCHNPVIVRFDKASKKHWLKEIAEDPAFWVNDAETVYPSILAYKYRNLRSLCDDCQPHGVLLSLKDNYETLLKFEILLACAWIMANTEEGVKERAIAQLMTPNLSFGAWIQIATILLKELKAAGKRLPETIPLDLIRKEYAKKEIVKWRNAKIGHGAMELAEDEDFISDIKFRIRELKEILQDVDKYLKNQELYVINNNESSTEHSVNISLSGADKARKLEHGGLLYFLDHISKDAVCIDPFIILREQGNNGNGIYFFENQRTFNITHFLSYADGYTQNEYVPLFEYLCKILDKGNLDILSQADDDYLSEAEIRQLDIPHMSHDFIKPSHIINWLQKCLMTHDKGIFWLQMPRGTGKSVLTEKLNRLFQNPEIICEDVDVRTYHFSRSQTSGLDDIRNAIEWQWKNAFNKLSWERGTSISDYEKEGYSPAQALCMFLRDVLQYSKRTRGCSRILMVLDGLDEITSDLLWMFIPEIDIMESGIFFLLTSRNSQEEGLSEEIKKRLNTIRANEIYKIERYSEEHCSFLRAYYKKTKLNIYPSVLFDRIAKLADYRTLYFGMLCRLLESGLMPENLPETAKIIEVYLKMLEKSYGEKEFEHLREILSIICSLGEIEAVPLGTISAIIGEGGITLRTIGIIRDLAPILKVERGEAGNLYTIANRDLAESVSIQITEVKGYIRWIIQLTLSLMKSNEIEKELELQPAAYNIVELAVRWLPEGLEALGEDADNILGTYIFNKMQSVHTINDRRIVYKHLKQLFIYRKSQFGEGHILTINCQGELARVTAELGLYEEALNTYKNVIEASHNEMDTITLRNNMITVLVSLNRLSEAESLARNVYNLAQNVLGEYHPLTLTSKANLAAVLGYLGDNGDALRFKQEDYQKTKELFGEDHPSTLTALNNLGFTLKDFGRDTEALEMFRKAYCGAKRNLGYDTPTTIGYLSNIGDVYTKLGAYQEALNIKKKVFEESQRMLGETHARSIVAQTELADAYADVGNYEKALQLYQGLYGHFREKYKEDNDYIWSIKKCIARVIAKQGNYRKAISLLEDVYLIYKRVKGEYSSETVFLQNEICALLSECGNYDEGIRCLKNTLRGCEHSLAADDASVIQTRINLAAAFDETGNTDEALKQYNEVYKIRKKKLSELHPDTLKIRYEIAVVLHNAAQNKKALQAYQEVYKAQCQVLGEGHPDTIASAKGLADTLIDSGRTSKALRLYERVYEKTKAAFGVSNSKTLTAQRDVANTLAKLGRKKQALEMHYEIFNKRQETLGDNHPDTLTSQNYIADLLIDLNYGEEALQCLKDVYLKRREVLGENNEDTLFSAIRLASVYLSIGNYNKFIEISKEALPKYISSLENKRDAVRYKSIIRSLKEQLESLRKYERMIPKHDNGQSENNDG